MKSFLTIILLLISVLNSSACAIFNIAQGNTVLVGNNEDWNELDNSIRFYPPSNKKYGRMLLKINKNGYPFGGMNDQGLFFDWCALTERSDIKFPSNRLHYNGILCEKMLAECATVSEAINLYKKYNDPWLCNGHTMIVDKSGASVIIEWGKDSLEIIKKKLQYQVLTNFNITNPYLAGWYPCWRYTKATEMLQSNTCYTVELFQQILNAVHQEGENQTIYSNIYDLKNGNIYLYNLHNFDKRVVLNLNNELSKGEKYYKLPDIFSEIDIIYPASKKVLASNSITFSWEGDVANYNLYCSTDSTFNNSTPIGIVKNNIVKSGFNFVYIVILLSLMIVVRLKKSKYIMLISILFIILFVSCEYDVLFETIEKLPLRNVQYTLDNLEPNTTYYWKIDAVDNAGFITESSVKQFTSGDKK